MPVYTYFCRAGACDCVWEITKGMNDPPPTKCPSCGYDDIDRDYSNDRIITMMEPGKPRTVGQLADKNTADMVKYGILPESHLEHEKNKKATIDKAAKAERFSKKTETEKMDYIITGKE